MDVKCSSRLRSFTFDVLDPPPLATHAKGSPAHENRLPRPEVEHSQPAAIPMTCSLPWLPLPLELVHNIVQMLSRADFLALRSTCRAAAVATSQLFVDTFFRYRTWRLHDESKIKMQRQLLAWPSVARATRELLVITWGGRKKKMQSTASLRNQFLLMVDMLRGMTSLQKLSIVITLPVQYIWPLQTLIMVTTALAKSGARVPELCVGGYVYGRHIAPWIVDTTSLWANIIEFSKRISTDGDTTPTFMQVERALSSVRHLMLDWRAGGLFDYSEDFDEDYRMDKEVLHSFLQAMPNIEHLTILGMARTFWSRHHPHSVVHALTRILPTPFPHLKRLDMFDCERTPKPPRKGEVQVLRDLKSILLPSLETFQHWHWSQSSEPNAIVPFPTPFKRKYPEFHLELYPELREGMGRYERKRYEDQRMFEENLKSAQRWLSWLDHPENEGPYTWISALNRRLCVQFSETQAECKVEYGPES